MNDTNRTPRMKVVVEDRGDIDKNVPYFAPPLPERTEEERKQDKIYWSERLIGKKLCDGPSTDDKVLLHNTWGLVRFWCHKRYSRKTTCHRWSGSTDQKASVAVIGLLLGTYEWHLTVDWLAYGCANTVLLIGLTLMWTKKASWSESGLVERRRKKTISLVCWHSSALVCLLWSYGRSISVEISTISSKSMDHCQSRPFHNCNMIELRIHAEKDVIGLSGAHPEASADELTQDSRLWSGLSAKTS